MKAPFEGQAHMDMVAAMLLMDSVKALHVSTSWKQEQYGSSNKMG